MGTIVALLVGNLGLLMLFELVDGAESSSLRRWRISLSPCFAMMTVEAVLRLVSFGVVLVPASSSAMLSIWMSSLKRSLSFVSNGSICGKTIIITPIGVSVVFLVDATSASVRHPSAGHLMSAALCDYVVFVLVVRMSHCALLW